MTSICQVKRKFTDERIENDAKRKVSKPTLPPWLISGLGGPAKTPSEQVGEAAENLICWWCVHSLPQLPCFHLPVKYDEKRDRFTTIGNFCTWECMKAYANDMATARSGEIQSFVALMRMKAYGKYMQLYAAPKRQALKVFGGSMTIDEFRSYYGKTPPPVYFPDQVQMHQVVGAEQIPVANGPMSSSSTSKLKAAINNSETKGDTLKLRRNKPLERSKSKLESTLGIIRKAK
jgi:hypothetical protein